MLILIGLKVSNALLATLVYVCETCGVNAPHDVVRRSRRLTVFFIPVLPVGTRYLDVCSNCGRARPMSQSQAESAASAPPASSPVVQQLPSSGPQDTPGWGPQDSPTWRP